MTLREQHLVQALERPVTTQGRWAFRNVALREVELGQRVEVALAEERGYYCRPELAVALRAEGIDAWTFFRHI